MLATNGPQWFDRRRPENHWPSIVVSLGLTTALFASAFVAMQTVGRWESRNSTPLEPPVVVHLTPPPPPIEKKRQPAPTPATPRAINPAAPTVTPTTIAPPSTAPMVAVPTPPVARDTAATGARVPPTIPVGPLAPIRTGTDTAMAARGGAANTQSGVTIGSRVPNTQAYRDSVARVRLDSIPFLARTHPPKGENLAALMRSQRAGAKVAQRGTTAGNPNVNVMQGEGVDGVGAVGGGAGVPGKGLRAGSSIGLPLLSKGPSAEQRKKNEILGAEYRAGLGRLQARILLRDSIRLDSLRRDSIAKHRRP